MVKKIAFLVVAGSALTGCVIEQAPEGWVANGRVRSLARSIQGRVTMLQINLPEDGAESVRITDPNMIEGCRKSLEQSMYRVGPSGSIWDNKVDMPDMWFFDRDGNKIASISVPLEGKEEETHGPEFARWMAKVRANQQANASGTPNGRRLSP